MIIQIEMLSADGRFQDSGESDMRKAIPEIDLEKCTGCGSCVELCPTGAVALVDGKVVVLRPDDCRYCTDCETVCPSGAIRCPFEIILVAGSQPRSTDKE